jgi:hypothetical protein
MTSHVVTLTENGLRRPDLGFSGGKGNRLK